MQNSCPERQFIWNNYLQKEYYPEQLSAKAKLFQTTIGKKAVSNGNFQNKLTGLTISKKNLQRLAAKKQQRQFVGIA